MIYVAEVQWQIQLQFQSHNTAADALTIAGGTVTTNVTSPVRVRVSQEILVIKVSPVEVRGDALTPGQ